MNQPRFFQEDTFHHLYNRGANKQKIFFDHFDYRFFKKKLYEYKVKYEMEILCYCLMPNHFHLFVGQTEQNKSIGKFIGDLGNSYTKSINKKYKRSGVLFEGSTKSKIVYEESAFMLLTKYILLNPVRAGLCTNFEDYEFSSAKELMGRSVEEITDKKILAYFENDTTRFEAFVSSADVKP